MSPLGSQFYDSGRNVEVSQFTYRDFRNLGKYTTTCPLRVIALIDFDAFYAQCEIVRLGLPADQPLAVVQFNNCIALNYAAKARGLKRIVSPEQAKAQCPEIVLQHVATWREGDTSWAYRDVKQDMTTDKSALDPYRKQSRAAFELIKSSLASGALQKVEKASIDEVFIDLSAQVYAVLKQRYPSVFDDEGNSLDNALSLPPDTSLNWQEDIVVQGSAESEAQTCDWDDVALQVGAEIVRKVRAEVYKKFNITCSAGVARNKSVAKLAAGHNKPNKQTIVRARAITTFMGEYKFTKLRGLGGKFGHKAAEAFGTDEMARLQEVSLHDMRAKLGPESGVWLYNIIRGIDYSEVIERTQLQSMLAAKTFVPKAKGPEQAEKWLRIFAGDLFGRLEEQDATTIRRPRVITMHHAIDGRFGPTRSKQMRIPQGVKINADLIFDLSRQLLNQISKDGPTWPCLTMSVAVSDFEDGIVHNRHLTSFWAAQSKEGNNDDGNSSKRKFQAEDDNTNEDSHRATKPAPFERLNTPDDAAKIKHESTIEQSSQESTPGCYRCPKCSRSIEATEVLEHLDWHVAMDLQNG